MGQPLEYQANAPLYYIRVGRHSHFITNLSASGYPLPFSLSYSSFRFTASPYYISFRYPLHFSTMTISHLSNYDGDFQRCVTLYFSGNRFVFPLGMPTDDNRLQCKFNLAGMHYHEVTPDHTAGANIEIAVAGPDRYRLCRTQRAFPCAVLAFEGSFYIIPNRCRRTPIQQIDTVDWAILSQYVDIPRHMHPRYPHFYVPAVDWTKPIAAEIEIDEDTVPPAVPIPTPAEAIPEGVEGPVRNGPTRLMSRRPKWSPKYQAYLNSIRNK